MRRAIFWLAFPVIVLITCVFYAIDAHEAQKKARYERGES